MTTAEIKAHINEVKEWHNRYGDYQGVKVEPLLAAIETLLARQAQGPQSHRHPATRMWLRRARLGRSVAAVREALGRAGLRRGGVDT